MKKFLSIIMACIMLAAFTLQSYAAIPGYKKPTRTLKVYLRGVETKMTLPILVNNGRTLYPFREILEKVGAKVSFNEKQNTAVADYIMLDKKAVRVGFPLNSSVYYVNGVMKNMDTKTAYDTATKRTYIPIRYALEAMGFDVSWISTKKFDIIRINEFKAYKAPTDAEVAKLFSSYDPFNFTEKQYFFTGGYFDFKPGDKRLRVYDPYYKTNGQPTPIILSEKLNPNIYTQLKNLIWALNDDMDQFQIKPVFMQDKPNDPLNSYCIISFAHRTGNVAKYPDMSFLFYDKQYFEYMPNDFPAMSKKAGIRLTIGCLWNGFDEEGMAKYWMVFPSYEKKLRDSMIALFGSSTGTKIYKYLQEIYIKDRIDNLEASEYIRQTKAIDKIQVDIFKDEGATIHVYFSYR